MHISGMKYILSVLGFLAFQVVLSQVSLRTNLPHTIALNRELRFEIRIKKGKISNFSKYQMEVPEGLTVAEVDSKTGTFAFEENAAKIVWVITPSEPEFSITLKFLPVKSAQTATVLQKYYYVENDAKKELELEPFVINFKDTVMPVVYSAPLVTLPAKTPSALLTSTINPADVDTKNPQELIQQIAQLRRDSKEAQKVGEREKAAAELKLSTANEAITAAESLTAEDEKNAALEKANTNKARAEEDLEVANRVLALAQSLADNADEIERINRAANPDSYGAGVSGTTLAANASTSSENGSKDVDKLKEIFKNESEPSKESPGSNNEQGLVYKVQLGAFKEKPAKSAFKQFGNVSVVNEDGKYKVLVGSYPDKEDALKKRSELLEKAPGCFVVSYQDGVRVK